MQQIADMLCQNISYFELLPHDELDKAFPGLGRSWASLSPGASQILHDHVAHVNEWEALLACWSGACACASFARTAAGLIVHALPCRQTTITQTCNL